MTHAGKRIRLARFFHDGPRFGIVVPIDHGLSMGPIDGIESVERIASWLLHPSISGTIAHKGIIERLAARDLVRRIGVMVHLTGMNLGSTYPDQKERLTSLESAVMLGADAVSLQANFDGETDAHNLRLIGRAVDEAQQFGLPVLAMIYDSHPNGSSLVRQQHLMRIAIELGVDALKIAPPKNHQEVGELLEHAAKDAEIFIAGGGLRKDAELLDLAEAATRHGAAGLCVGRNVFQRSEPGEFLARLHERMVAGFSRDGESVICARIPSSDRIPSVGLGFSSLTADHVMPIS
jgi:class I fructose-bisphosphate aldolase/fructose-bisphosphate aldolase/2-amino-3,7-dideoxy-D-threo-hept-6-ulosonate synthase